MTACPPYSTRGGRISHEAKRVDTVDAVGANPAIPSGKRGSWKAGSRDGGCELIINGAGLCSHPPIPAPTRIREPSWHALYQANICKAFGADGRLTTTTTTTTTACLPSCPTLQYCTVPRLHDPIASVTGWPRSLMAPQLQDTSSLDPKQTMALREATEITLLPVAATTPIEDTSTREGEIWASSEEDVASANGCQAVYWSRWVENQNMVQLIISA